MIRRTAPDRCPGVLALHEARDGALARVRLPGGRLTAAQLRAVADVAASLGSGLVDLTVRANIQIRGLAGDAGGAVAERLDAAGLLPSLAHERARTILASPLAGRDAAARLDARPLVNRLDALICDDPALAELPGRFAFLVEDGSGAMAGVGHDVALAPVASLGGPDDGRLALVVGGEDAGLRAEPAAAPAMAAAAARAFLAERGRSGSGAWRVCELPGGPAAVIARARAALRGEAAIATAPPGRWAASASPPGPAGPLTQPDGRVALGAVVPLGRLEPGALRALAAASERGAGEVRLSVWRTALVPDLPSAAVAPVAAALARAGMACDAGSPWLGLSACAGLEGCASALADVRAAAARRAGARRAADPPEHHSGCERRCGEPAGPVAAVVAGGAP